MKRFGTFFYFIKLLLILCLCYGMSGCGDDEKVVKDLIREISTNAQETEQVGRALQLMALLEQAEGLDTTALCKATRDIYCALFQMVRDNCLDQNSFCQTVADALYGGSFPGGLIGMNACISVADDKCNELQGHSQVLQQLCIDLGRRCN